jgi:site-specific recombinase XerD
MLVEQQNWEGETMSAKMISKTLITAYLHQLECDEKASATIEKYRHDINLFYEFLPGEKGMLQRASIQCW